MRRWQLEKLERQLLVEGDAVSFKHYQGQYIGLQKALSSALVVAKGQVESPFVQPCSP